jgi:hypothetical protein
MAPRGRKPGHPAATQPCAVKATKDATEFYSDTVLDEAKSAMQALEGKLHIVREFKEVDEVEEEVGGLILDMGCTRTKNSIFFCTIELYWHTKTLVALGLFPKDEDFRQLKGCMEALEIQNTYIMEILSWMENRLGGTFTPPKRHYSGPKSLNVVAQRNASAATHPQVSHDH